MATYKPIQTVVITSTTAGITFSGISQDYTDLELRIDGLSTSEPSLDFRLNGDTSSSYSYIQLSGTGSSVVDAYAASQTSGRLDHYGYLSTSAGYSNRAFFMNYSDTTSFKQVLSKSGNANNGVSRVVGLWRKTEAITSITLTPTFAAGTTISLYGIKSGAPQALGGDTVTTDGNYWYHTFTTTGSFSLTTQKPLTVDYLVVAGGGAGGAGQSGSFEIGGGGGAGGYRTSIGGSSFSLTGTSYTVIVGAGGTGSSNSQGTGGSDSTFATITSTGGGRGAGATQTLLNGGSGGGAPSWSNYASPGTGTVGQGNNGGNGGYNGSIGQLGGGGGGGAGAVGGNATNGNGTGGAGGVGVANSISGTSTYYAGGGGGCGSTYYSNPGGSGGNGGGGNGASPTSGASSPSPTGGSGAANTGGGGGGAIGNPGGNGGSGVVIVRYAV